MSHLIPSISVPGLVAERAKRIEAARAALDDSDTHAFVDYLLEGRLRYERDRILDRYIEAEDRRCWGVFIKESGLWDLFPRARREEWMKALGWGDYQYRHREQDCPEFTASAALATFQEYAQQKKALQQEALLALFRSLSWDHKTNQPALFGPKLIYRGFCRYSGGINFRSHDMMDDLLRQLYRLDGKPEPVGRWHLHDNATGYFQVKTFKNRNAHILMERMDLVDRLNAELASICPGALPAPRHRAA